MNLIKILSVVSLLFNNVSFGAIELHLPERAYTLTAVQSVSMVDYLGKSKSFVQKHEGYEPDYTGRTVKGELVLKYHDISESGKNVSIKEFFFHPTKGTVIHVMLKVDIPNIATGRATLKVMHPQILKEGFTLIDQDSNRRLYKRGNVRHFMQIKNVQGLLVFTSEYYYV